MSTKQNNIEALERAIVEEANEEAHQIHTEAQAEIERIQRDVRVRIKAEEERILQRAEKDAQSIRSHSLAAAQLDAQNTKLRRRELLLQSTFDKARERLTSVPQRPDYQQILRLLVTEAIHHVGAHDVTIRADRSTVDCLSHEFLTEIEQELGVKLAVGQPLERGAGVIVETPDGHRRYDNTLDTRLDRMQNGLRTLVYRILMGEAA